MNQKDGLRLERILAYQIQDMALFDMAFTHRSLSSIRTKNKGGGKSPTSNERLEFLGDRILGLVIADMLYHEFPHEPEGALAKRFTALVNGHQIAVIMQALKLHDFMLLSAGEEQSGGRDNPALQANMGEAVIGALWLDDRNNKGAAATAFIKAHWQKYINETLTPPKDAKSALQEWCMAKQYALPDYQLVNQTGSDHAPEFTLALTLPHLPTLKATHRTRKGAEQKLAQAMLNAINKI